VPFDAAIAWGERVLRPLIEAELPPRSLVNVNFPALPAAEVRGVKVVRQGLRDYGRLAVEDRTDPRGFPYMWLSMGRKPHEPEPDTDLAAAADGYVSVTPLHLDLTHAPSLAMVKDAFA
jgi:5'-nucleotidase